MAKSVLSSGDVLLAKSNCASCPPCGLCDANPEFHMSNFIIGVACSKRWLSGKVLEGGRDLDAGIGCWTSSGA